jgi:hypothetical protein
VLDVADTDPALFNTWVEEICTREKNQAERDRWTTTHELLAVVGQMVSILNRNFVAANAKKGAQLPEVWEPRRPGDDRKKKFSAREFAKQLRG